MGRSVREPASGLLHSDLVAVHKTEEELWVALGSLKHTAYFSKQTPLNLPLSSVLVLNTVVGIHWKRPEKTSQPQNAVSFCKQL